MSRTRSDEHFLSDEFVALIKRARNDRDIDGRLGLFRALLDLERRAGLADVSDRFLRQINEARFLTGILRECVGPASHAAPPGAWRIPHAPKRQAPGGGQDLDAVGAVQV